LFLNFLILLSKPIQNISPSHLSSYIESGAESRFNVCIIYNV
jgi:hypothetical protein